MPTKKNSTSTKKNNGKQKQTNTKSSSSSKINLLKIIKDERFIKVSGLFLLLLSFYLIVSFTSYMYNWFFDGNETRHWAGGLGYKIADQFIKVWFGLSSYILTYWVFLLGLSMLVSLNKRFLSRTFKYTLVLLLWISLSLGYVFQSNDELGILGGFFGIEIIQIIQTLIGKVGTGILLLFILLSITTVAYNIPLKWFKSRPKKETEEKTDIEDKQQPDQKGFDIVEAASVKNKNKENAPVADIVDETEWIDSSEEESEETIQAGNYDLSADIPVNNKPKNNSSEPDFIIEEVKPEINEQEEEDSDEEQTHFGIDSPYDPTLDLKDFKGPDTELLTEYNDGTVKIRKEELEENKNKIVETLNHYSIKIDKIKATIGPTVTLYEIIPAPGVRISKIKNLEDDIALSLSAMGIRIIAPIPGKGTIGIEVPNSNSEIVSMKSLLDSDKFRNSKYELPVAIGKTISNEIFITDLTKMPHLLMAGATGQGKSVGLNAIIASLLYKKHPATLKFVMVDPKKVELSLYSKIERHYLACLPDMDEAIITDTRVVVRTLNSLCIEMDARYDLLKDAQVRNIKEYNTKFVARKLNPQNGHRFLPYIVLVVDEFADLIMTAGKEVEGPITRLAQLARAIGIHLIIATQRPSVNIITGTIKANFPARIAFRVISKIDSRTILDTGGAEQLIGRGDMLLSTGGEVVRLQCAFVDTPEVDNICDFIGTQRGYPEAFQLPEYLDEETETNKEFEASDRDELFEEAARMVVSHQHGSTSLLQRKLKLGYNRAGRIIDQLEAAGIVGPFEGSKAREVRVSNEMALEQHLQDIENRNNGN
ncbi:MAG: DNA translocase FtsK [Bacteroidales bacterium]|nr:DNA translocase FtsK [Bacteroidales bacterium]